MKPQITLATFLKRAAEEDLASLLEETEEIQSRITADLKNNGTSVSSSEHPAQTTSPLISNSTVDHNVNAHSRELIPTQEPRRGRPRNTLRSTPTQSSTASTTCQAETRFQ